MVLPIHLFKRDVSRLQNDPEDIGYKIYNDTSAQDLQEHLFDEMVQKMGIEVIYMPRTFTNIDKVLGEDHYSKFEQYKMFKLKMALPKTDTWDGGNEIFMAQGMFNADRVLLSLAISRFGYEAQEQAGLLDLKPQVGDLIQVVMSEDYFELKHVELENEAFFHRGKRIAYQLRFHKFAMGGETMQRDTPENQRVEDVNAYDPIIPERQGNQVIDEYTKSEDDPIIDPTEHSIFGDY